MFLVVVNGVPSWPPAQQLQREADRLHRWCRAEAAGSRPWPGEEVGACLRYRACVAARLVAPEEAWGRRVAVAARAAHVALSEAMCARWPARVLQCQYAVWVNDLRIAPDSASSYAGRVGARAAIGRVAPRWLPCSCDARHPYAKGAASDSGPVVNASPTS